MRKDRAGMGLSRDDLAALLSAFEQHGWSELVLSVNGTRVELANSGQPPASATRAPAPPPIAAPTPQVASAAAYPAPATPPAMPATAPPQAQPNAPAATDAAALHEVVAPSVGIFYE